MRDAPNLLALPQVPSPLPSAHLERPRWVRWSLVFAAWTVYGLGHGVLWKVTQRLPNEYFRYLLLISTIVAWCWALLTPAIVWLTRRLDASRLPGAARVTVHVVAALAAAFLMAVVRQSLIFEISPLTPLSLLPSVLYWLDVSLITYGAVAVIGHALHLHRRYRERTVRAHMLEVELARAQLQFLELQLQPHFLFNCLNAISELAHEAPNAAERMLRQLHTLLRHSLDRAGQDEVTLDEELASLEPYIDIQRTRFSEWLTVRQEVEPAARAGLVPHLILQPLVENAIRHGLAVRSAPGLVIVRAWVGNGRLHLQVEDDGVGLGEARHPFRPGIGLRNARNRLVQLYGDDHRFELRPADHGGTMVDLEMPFRSRDLLAAAPPPDWSATGEWSSIASQRLWNTPSAGTPVLGAGSHLGSDSPVGTPAVAAAAPPALRSNGSELYAASLAGLAPEVSPAEVRRIRGVHAQPANGVPNQNAGTVKAGRESPRLTRRVWLSVLVLWAVLGVFWTWQVWSLELLLGESEVLSLPEIAVREFASAAVWAALTPLVLFLARKLRITRRNWPQRFVVHGLAAIGLAFAHIALVAATGLLGDAPLFSINHFNPITGDVFLYFGILAWSHSRDFYAWYREREVAASRLESAIARSRYQTLCVQLRPQFLLSTVELLARLVHQDVQQTERLITRLADVLRLTLEAAVERDTTLRRELELLRAYVEVHRTGIRPGTRLRVRVPSECLSVRLPNRLIRTLVDDLLCGSSGVPGDIEILVEAEREEAGTTRITVSSTTPPSSLPAEVPDPSRRALWADTVETASLAEPDRKVTLFFPDATTAIVVLADREERTPADTGSRVALAARPA